MTPVSPREPRQSVPIPATAQPKRKKSRVMQSSLDLVFSYSRSQQMRYGKLNSAPSFVDPSLSFSSPSDPSGSGGRRRFDSGEAPSSEDSEEDIDEEPEELDPRRHSSLLFQSDSDSRQISPVRGLEASVATIKPAAQPGDSGFRHLFSTSLAGPSVLGTSAGTVSSSASKTPRAALPRIPSKTPSMQSDDRGPSPTSKVDESTPLLRDPSPMSSKRRASRRMSVYERGESTDGQTLFNGVAVLVGIGLLSLPLAFSYAGWIGGTAMLIGFAWLTCYTAKLLARLISADRSMLGYTDIGRKAFGGPAGLAINLLFCLELFALGVALIVLFGDSLNAIFPEFSSNTFKFFGFFIILPTALMPLRLLSLPSLLSTVSSFLLVGIILIDGLWKQTPPGSLIHPAETNLFPEWENANWLGGVGLVLAGFGGHAVVPSLARDMKHPENFDRVINKAFIIATGISFVSGACGYLMIGNGVSDEITRDLLLEKYGYPRWLNLFALWMIVINPLTKFGLCSRPLNVTIENFLGVSNPPRKRAPSESGFINASSAILSGISRTSQSPSPKSRKKLAARIVSRTIVTAACTAAAIGLPGFGKVMAFLGSFSAFLICIILPLLFYIRLAPKLRIEGNSARSRLAHVLLIALSVCLMIAGTTWAFIPGAGHGELKE